MHECVWAAEDLGSLPPHRRPSLGIALRMRIRRMFSDIFVEENIPWLPAALRKVSGEETRAGA